MILALAFAFAPKLTPALAEKRFLLGAAQRVVSGRLHHN